MPPIIRSIQTLLIANRGEIAMRIIRTSRKMGIRTVAVFSEADRQTAFEEAADVAVYIGPSDPLASYLKVDNIIAAARQTRADAIHPGYGFLSENADFARQCESAGLLFIGPHTTAIESMGSKSKAKTLMMEHEVPVIPGYQGEDQSSETLTAAATEIGFPVLLKAAAGGGGKGMRIVNNVSEMPAAIAAAKREAQTAFGVEELIVEKYIAAGRHIEFQIFGDRYGKVLHLLERECSLQRRYQKVMEESPSPVVGAQLRTEMGAAAIRVAKALHYDNAGTVEFILDDSTQAFYFLEVNTRLQVEHPVTEAITGLDLVQMQIEVAQGHPLAIEQANIRAKGYAIELRLYAEDPNQQFLPVSGVIEQFKIPQVEGLRVETAIRDHSEVSIFYDPMIAKLIVWGDNRALAQQRMRYVLDHLICLGIQTNQNFLRTLLAMELVREGKYTTSFIEEQLPTLVSASPPEALSLFAMATMLYDWAQRENSRTLLRSLPSGWRNNFLEYQRVHYQIGATTIELAYRYQSPTFVCRIGEEAWTVHLLKAEGTTLRMEIAGMQYPFVVAQRGLHYHLHNERLGNQQVTRFERFPENEVTASKGSFTAPMPSQVVKVLVEEGQLVKAGEGLIVLTSMKMENTLHADEDGKVTAIYTQAGENVAAGFLLLQLE
ncbi:MAG: biotin carboxylase N-terminal domain-containing protein, partial [Bacteroidota bacterium]